MKAILAMLAFAFLAMVLYAIAGAMITNLAEAWHTDKALLFIGLTIVAFFIFAEIGKRKNDKKWGANRVRIRKVTKVSPQLTDGCLRETAARPMGPPSRGAGTVLRPSVSFSRCLLHRRRHRLTPNALFQFIYRAMPVIVPAPAE